jgi:glutathione S-transferase
VLRETERHFDLERVDLATHRTSRGVDYFTINAKGYVPALEIDERGDETLTEVSAIVQFLADLVPDKRLAPANGTFARYHLQEWLNFIASEIHKPLGQLFAPDLPELHAGKLRGRVAERFNYIQSVLADRAFLMGETFTVADAYLFVMLQWCDRFHIDIQLWPNIDDYEFRISRRPTVLAAMSAEGLVDRHHLIKHSA